MRDILAKETKFCMLQTGPYLKSQAVIFKTFILNFVGEKVKRCDVYKFLAISSTLRETKKTRRLNCLIQRVKPSYLQQDMCNFSAQYVFN